MTTKIILHASVVFLFITVCSRNFHPLFLLYAVAALVFWRKWKQKYPLLLCRPYYLCIGAVATAAVFWNLCSVHIDRMQKLPFAKENQVTAVGTVTEIIQKETSTSLLLADSYCQEGHQIIDTGTILVYLDSGVPLLEKKEKLYGASVRLSGVTKPFSEAGNDGAFDEKKYYMFKGVNGKIYAEYAELSEPCRNPYIAATAAFRQSMQNQYEKFLSKKEAGVVESMLLGERSRTEAEIKELYQEGGISHLLAISGLHVSLIGMFFYRMLLKISCPKKAAAVSSTLLMVFYVIMSGASVSACRAGFMFAVMMLSFVWNRKYEGKTALALSAAVQLAIQPELAANLSFLYSYLAAAAILFLAQPAGKWMHERKICTPSANRKAAGRKSFGKRMFGQFVYQKLLIGKIADSLIVSSAIQFVLLPLVMYSNYEVVFISLLLNIVVLPLAPAVLLMLLFGGILSVFLYGAAEVLAVSVPGFTETALHCLFLPVQYILQFYELLCRWAKEFPFSSVLTGKPELSQVLAVYLLFLITLVLLSDGKQRWLNGKWGLLLVGAAFMILLYRPPVGFRIVMLDVGQGDGIFLQTDRSHACFIDGGSSSKKLVGKYQILPFLKSNKIRTIDYWFVSHADSDHISGLIEVLDSGYPVRFLVYAKAQKMNEELEAAVRKAGTKVLYVTTGQRFMWEHTVISVLAPTAETMETAESMETAETMETAGSSVDKNEASLVLYLKHNDFSALFGGDISSVQEEKLAQTYDLSNITCFKADHHGSKNSNSEVLLEEMKPQVTIISAGENNRYGHPHAEALERIRDASKSVYMTVGQGQISILEKKGEYVVE